MRSGGLERGGGDGAGRCENARMDSQPHPRSAGPDRPYPLADLTERVRAFADEREWHPFHTPKNLAMAVAGEAGELVAEFQWLTPDESAAVMADAAAGPRVCAEMADVLIYLVRLADVLGVDLVEAAVDKLAEAAVRYPPTARSRGDA
jgi:NTP pyrophosphatase (non-canonical NTP hydrolase)